MRPDLVDLLERAFGTRAFTYLVPTYFIMLGLGAVAGTAHAARSARRVGLDPDPVYGLILWALPAALIGGRLFHWLYAPEAYDGSVLAVFDPLRGDSVAYGGFIAASATTVLYLKLRGAGVLRYLDCAVAGLGIGQASTRAGCFLDGCDYGSLSSSPLAVTFPNASPAHAAHAALGLIATESARSLPVHPVQLYLALLGVTLAVIVTWRLPRRRHRPGETFCLFWILYAAGRFAIEFLRGDPERGFLGPLATSQAVSVPVFVLALAGFLACRRRVVAAREARGAPP